MNRINQMIDIYATIAASTFFNAVLCARDGSIEESAEFSDMMLKARSELKMWLKISQAIRGWQL